MPTQTGTITTASSTVTISIKDANITVVISGTYAGVEAVFEASIDGSIWFPLGMFTSEFGDIKTSTGVITNLSRGYGTSEPRRNVTNFRVRAIAHTSGTANVTITATPDTVNLGNVSLSSDSFIKVTQEPRDGNSINFYSPNMCDRTTWYENSTPVAAFGLTDSGDHATYNTNGSHPGPWIDMHHGKLFSEDQLIVEDPTRATLVEVQFGGTGSWIEQTQNTFDDTDGDYLVDYQNGTITFNSVLDVSDLVRATFCEAPSIMTWTMQPSAGKRLKLMYAECQMTIDMEMTDDVWYQTWAYNPYDYPNKFKVAELRYKTLSDLLYESTGVYPKIPAFGGTGPRGIGNKEVVIFPFNYSAAKDIRASQGIEVRIVTNKVHIGTMSTTTLYCLEEDE